MRLAARRRRDDIAGAHRKGLVAKSVLSGALQDEEQLVDHVMAVKRKGALAGRHHRERAAEPGRAEHRPDPPELGGELVAVAEFPERNVGKVDDGLLGSRHSYPRYFRGYPTLPSSEIEISFCASTANSIGSCCSTSLTKPLTTSATASSSERPRCMQ